MPSPQIEDGYTRIANEILDMICQFAFNGAQLRIIIKVWRMTYGYSRKDHEFAVSFLAETTGLSEKTVKKEIASLIKSKVISVTKKQTNVSARKLAFNKNYEEWIIPKSGERSLSDEYDLFSYPEGKYSTPPTDDVRGEVLYPSEGKYSTPQNPVLRGSIVPPYKEIRSLKKSIKEKEILFEPFWVIYPRKIKKSYAKLTWDKHCKLSTFDPDQVIANTINFSETHKLLETSAAHIPHASTYLNQKYYQDYEKVDPEGIATVKQTKLDSNIEFLRGQIGGDRIGPGTSSNALREGNGLLSE